MPARSKSVGTEPADVVSLVIRVRRPPPGVRWALQLGRQDLVPPAKVSADELRFEFSARVVESADGGVDLRGPAVQGPRGGRFVYLTCGKRAGDPGSPWDRRAKVPLEPLRVRLGSAAPRWTEGEWEAQIEGVGRDGGPACASVPLVGGEWTLRSRAS